MKSSVKTLVFSAILGLFIFTSASATPDSCQGETMKSFSMVTLVEMNASLEQDLTESQELAVAQMATDLVNNMEQNAALEMYEPNAYLKRAAAGIVETAEANALAQVDMHLEEAAIAKAITTMVEENAANDAE